MAGELTAAEQYELLATEFDETFTDNRGGVDLTYITGEQVTTRLNEVLGPGGWTFSVKEHGFNQEADEYWVLGHFEADLIGGRVVREQFGSQKVKRSRANGNPLDVGFDLKGAATDALKKCATLIGVGLYLSHKESKGPPRQQDAGPARQTTAVAASDGAQACQECGAALTETHFKDGTTWSVDQLAGLGRRKHGKVLCMTHYRGANEARKAAVG